LPAAIFIGPDLPATLPGCLRRCFASRMGELDRDRHVRIAPHDLDHSPQRLFGLVGPEAKIVGADAPLRRDRSGFDHQKPRSGQCEVAEMDDMPVRRTAFAGRILTHGRNHDAVAQREGADPERGEQRAHLVLSCWHDAPMAKPRWKVQDSGRRGSSPDRRRYRVSMATMRPHREPASRYGAGACKSATAAEGDLRSEYLYGVRAAFYRFFWIGRFSCATQCRPSEKPVDERAQHSRDDGDHRL
jgi:hypothetical protein